MTVRIPESLIGGGADVRCRWVETDGERYADPFFHSTLARMRLRRPQLALTPLETVHERAAAVAPANPAAIIFHVSRCGSTLFGQLLAEAGRAAVVSEAPVLDQILRSGRDDRFALFDAALRLMASGTGRGTPLFVKTDCWHVFDAPALRRLYPESPFIFLYRSPAAVLASQQRGRGSHMVPGVLPGSAIGVPFDPAVTSIEAYGARVLARIYRALLDAAAGDPRGLLVSYDEGFPRSFLRAARWLGLGIDASYRERIDARCRYHGKRPEEAFAGDPAPPPAPAGGADLEEAYRLLEELRTRGARATV